MKVRVIDVRAAMFALVAGLSTAFAIVIADSRHPAEANSCQQSCRAQWNQCRIATKGSSSCDAQLRACMQSCIPSR
jgi:hypothetical protein